MSLNYTDANSLRYQLRDLPLPDDVDRAQFNALLTAGVRDCLLQELDQLAEIRARKEAALEVSQAIPWGETGRRIATRRAWLAANPWARREVTG
ncbi:DUF2742 domain-containing protein [Gordonia bronchialis]|uniref:DUF2742 domain-containing protein n=1 Tax=Gordonia bronchialis TaxID=2054 RepID=UPI001CC10A9B|nr:DUF2742 domain-containing protein [Gordonia bronchialis]UAK38564.1 DUF2742 domain-containing protein [Gordonia bronchialis]